MIENNADRCRAGDTDGGYTAYAVPIGISRAARASSTKIDTTATRKRAVGSDWVKPCVFFNSAA